MYYAIVKDGQVERVLFSPETVEINEVKHPKAIFDLWTDAELIAGGIYPYEESKSDGRFYDHGALTYDVQASKVVGTYAGIPKDLTLLQTSAIALVKRQAGDILSKTDWMVIKVQELGLTLDPAIATYRESVRARSNTIETSISSCTTLDEFMALYDVPVDANGVPTGNAPIVDWPEEV